MRPKSAISGARDGSSQRSVRKRHTCPHADMMRAFRKNGSDDKFDCSWSFLILVKPTQCDEGMFSQVRYCDTICFTVPRPVLRLNV